MERVLRLLRARVSWRSGCFVTASALCLCTDGALAEVCGAAAGLLAFREASELAEDEEEGASATAVAPLPPRARSPPILPLWLAAETLASSVSFRGSLTGPGVSALGGAGALALAALGTWLYLTPCFLVHTALAAARPASPLAPLAFAACTAAAWRLASATGPFGAFPSPATSLQPYPALSQLASVFGSDGLVALVGWAAAVACGLWPARGQGHARPTRSRGATTAATATAARSGSRGSAVAVATDANEGGGGEAGAAAAAAAEARRRVYTRHAAALAAALCASLAWGDRRVRAAARSDAAARHRLRVGCVLRTVDMGGGGGSVPLAEFWGAVEGRIAAGDHIVLSSETAVGTADEDALLARARRATAAGGSYLGLGYDAPAASGGGGDEEDERQGSGGGGGQRRNAFALLRPHSGGVAFRYAKAYPVPLVEHGYAAGPPELPSPAEAARPFPPSEEGGGGDWPALNASSAAPLVVRLSALICFDADFPRLVAQAGAPGSPRRADALLQPAQTWGGPRFRARHFRGDALRALENGVVLLRCAADGVSGAAGPAGQAWGTWAATGHSGVHTFSVPWPPGGAGGGGGGAATPFARGGGALLGAAAVAGAAAAVVALAVSAAPAAPAAAAGRAREEEERARSGDVAALA